MAPKGPSFPGFTTLTDQVFVREGEPLSTGASPSPSHPRVVIVFGWGDAAPKHVVKYTDGYRLLYPHAKQIAVLSSIRRGMLEDVQQRAAGMRPVIEAAYPPEVRGRPDEDAVLVQTMSNMGGINFASTMEAYRKKYDGPMPQRLVVYDSTPGSPFMTWETLVRWSDATAMGLAAYVPLPYVVTKVIAGMLLAAVRGVQNVMGWEPAPIFSNRAMTDERYVPRSVRKLYYYGPDDRIIHFSEIEENIANVAKAGYKLETVVFEGSGHVGHMRLHPDKYWGGIASAWKEVAGPKAA
ncbi:paxu protein [Colletotrichum plurivorum]|uniref:Paxu protein n=1 Tax=Colletotrichum plurivorum TaxID=2175906 RepID=A0A8H6KI73_9PEZI|nr:paxu protein [Colletotrichum plurivorum]